MTAPKYSATEIRKLYEGGLTIDQITVRTGYSHGTVQRKLKAAKTRMRPVGRPLAKLKERAASELLAAGWEPADVGIVLELESSTIHRLTSSPAACACCGDVLESVRPPLCERCAPTYTTYIDGTASCDEHQTSNGTECAE
jgi:hypothetical protein